MGPPRDRFTRRPRREAPRTYNAPPACQTAPQAQTAYQVGEIREGEGYLAYSQGQEGVGRGEAGVGEQVGMEGTEQREGGAMVDGGESECW